MSKANEVEKFVAKKIGWLTSSMPNLEPRQRAALAKLRRGVGCEPGELPEVWDITLADLPEELLGSDGEVSQAEQAIHTSLTLFALHQQGKAYSVSLKKVSFGSAVRKLVQPDKGNEQTIKRRFDAALTSKDFQEFARHARSLILIAKANDICLDYPKFAKDLYKYQNPDLRTKIMLEWGQYFWAPIQEDQNNTEGEQS